MMLKISWWLTFFILSTQALLGQVFHSADTAFLQASEKNQAVLLVFSGSDWCAPCIRFDKTILQNEAFQHFSQSTLTILKADFPQRKKLSKHIREQNDQLAETYNPQGYFPHILLLNSNRTVIQTLSFQNQTPREFIEQLQALLGKAPLPRKEYRYSTQLMGSAFEFAVVAPSHHAAKAQHLLKQGEAEVKRIEALISSWKDDSQTASINHASGVKAVKVDDELFQLIKRSAEISQLTQGAFDITFAALDPYYHFDGTQNRLPDPKVINKTLPLIGYRQIQLTPPDQIYLPTKGMKIGFGAIGKGYAADKVKKLLQNQGVKSGLINAGGDLVAWGKKADGSPWKIGIADPFNKKDILMWLEVQDQAIVTSGNYEKFIQVGQERYAHIIDPRSGQPAQGVVSVTVVQKSAELADALASAVFVLGVEVGLDLINQLPDTECIIVDSQKNIHYSQHIKYQQTDGALTERQ
ncbi:FAD:protein FMN transferase [Rapidithrix thailandica]|uniref:FAD:protein FMN transferase n=1 Tax=Rapidithrix thailandica TaxID=413964 RepID=A0AAW9S2P1_9BACT